MRYIRRIRTGLPDTSNANVVHIQWSDSPEGTLVETTRGQVAWDIEYKGCSYHAYDEATGASAPVITRTTSAGIRYIACTDDGVESTQLLRLPQF